MMNKVKHIIVNQLVMNEIFASLKISPILNLKSDKILINLVCPLKLSENRNYYFE